MTAFHSVNITFLYNFHCRNFIVYFMMNFVNFSEITISKFPISFKIMGFRTNCNIS